MLLSMVGSELKDSRAPWHYFSATSPVQGTRMWDFCPGDKQAKASASRQIFQGSRAKNIRLFREP